MAEYQTLVDVFERSAREYASRPALGTLRNGKYEYASYAEIGENVAHMRAGLATMGVGPGDAVALVSNNCEEWAVVAFAAYGLGALVVPMYRAQSPREWAHILADSGAKVAFGADKEVVDALRGMQKEAPALERVLSFEGTANDRDSYKHLLSFGTREAIHPRPEDVATFIYTSGTTGMPKGVVLTHANFVSNIIGVHEVFRFEPDDRSLAFLPWAHSFGQTCELYLLLSMGCSLAINDVPERLVDNMLKVQPTVLYAVPRVFNKLYGTVHEQVSERPAVLQHLFQDGLHFATEQAHGAKLHIMQRLKLALSDKLIFARVRAKFGGRLKYAISASAALNPAVAEFMQALGITVYEGYGLTETSPIVSVNYPGHQKIGSVGKPLPNVRVTIDSPTPNEPGEIVVYGPNVMQGYHNRPEETQKIMTPDGGLRTGDLGYLDKHGYLYVTGRIKEQYKLENGKYVMPSPLEEQLKLSPLIANVLLYGDNRPYNIALVVPEKEALRRRAAEAGESLDEALESTVARELVRNEIEEFSKDFRGYEKPKNFALLTDDFTCENGLLTPTLKLRRAAVVARYQKRIDALYIDVSRPAKGRGARERQSPKRS